MNITLGIFKKIFPSSLFTLACQLWTKNTNFKYLEPNDAVEKTSANDVTSFYLLYGTDPRQALYNTTVWIDSSGENGIAIPSMRSNNGGQYYMLEHHPALTAPAIPYYNFDESVRGIQGNTSYVGKVNSPGNLQVGGIHLEDDGIGGQIIVAYKLYATSSGVDRVVLSRYSTAYDETLDQSTIADFITGTADYEGTFYETDVALPFYVNGGTENIYDLIGSNRQLCCDSTGRKIVFFTDSWNTDISQVIFEAVDNGTAITITKHSEYTGGDTTIWGEQTESISGSASITGNHITHHYTYDGSATRNHSITSTRIRATVFLGCAYSRYNDEILLLTKEVNNTSYAGQTTYNTMSVDADSTCVDPFIASVIRNFTLSSDIIDDGFNGSASVIYLNDTPITEQMKGEYSATGSAIEIQTGTSTTGSSVVTSQVSMSSKEVTLNSFYCIDLASKLFVYEISEQIIMKSGNVEYTNTGTQIGSNIIYGGDMTTTDNKKIVVLANEIETIAHSESNVLSEAGGLSAVKFITGNFSITGDFPDGTYTGSAIYIDTGPIQYPTQFC